MRYAKQPHLILLLLLCFQLKIYSNVNPWIAQAEQNYETSNMKQRQSDVLIGSPDDLSQSDKCSNRGYYFKVASAYNYYCFDTQILALPSANPTFVRDKTIHGHAASIEGVLGRNLQDKCIPIRFDFHYIHVFERSYRVGNYFRDKAFPGNFNNAVISFYSDQFLVNIYWDFFKYQWLTLYLGGGGGIGIHSTKNRLVEDGSSGFSSVNEIFFSRNVNAIADAEVGLNFKVIKMLALSVFGRYTYLGLIETETRPQLSSSIGDKNGQQFSIGGSLNLLF